MRGFTKFNIVLGFLSVISALGNIYVGTMTASSNLYTQGDLLSAITQIVLAILIVITGFINLNPKFKESLLAKSHIYIAIGSYLLGAVYIYIQTSRF